MNVIWSESALEIFSATADYIQDEFGDKTRDEFVQKVTHTARLLERDPGLGIVEPRLVKAPVEYHSINAGDDINRIIYFVEGDIVQIADFWNMRRNPKTLAKRLLP